MSPAHGFRGRNVVSAEDFSKQDLLYLLDAATFFERDVGPRLAGKILATLFFEPSTRTRLSFESAMHRLGGSVVGFADATMTSTAKGESLADTIRMVESYCDAIVIRHPKEGAARLAAETAHVPVINGGDGSNQHPTQTFLDLYTIRKATGQARRAPRRVLRRPAVRARGPQPRQGAPPLRRRHDVRRAAHARAARTSCGRDFAQAGRLGRELDSLDAVDTLDVLYVTRIQKERFPDAADYEKVKHGYRLDRAAAERFGPELKILHPLPRVTELDPDVDALPGALYFEQAKNGVTVRKALLSLILSESSPELDRG